MEDTFKKHIGAVVMVKLSAFSPSIPTILIQILLNDLIVQLFERIKINENEGRVIPLKTCVMQTFELKAFQSNSFL